jgi:hypothetical protein
MPKCEICGEKFIPEYKGAKWCESCAEAMAK